MDWITLFDTTSFFWTPGTVAVLVVVAVLLVWFALAPAELIPIIKDRLDSYVIREGFVDDVHMRQSFTKRVIIPLFRRLLKFLGSLLPKRNLEKTQQLLIEAGEPGSLSALDFLGLKLLIAILFGGGYLLFFGRASSSSRALQNTLMLTAGGYLYPQLWLKQKVRKRKSAVLRALPDALDMLTISVEAGLAFESALLKVAAQWDNVLSQEFRRSVAEMRVGAPRNDALKRMAERTGVKELNAFVSALIQSTQLGMSIAEVLHLQADEMRVKRRQLAEEKARQAGTKMVFPLVFLIFPAMYVVILGPGIPMVAGFFQGLGH
jgi:tight adherence protein C